MAADSPLKTSNASLLPLLLQVITDRQSSMEARIQHIERTMMTRTADSSSKEQMGTRQSLYSMAKEWSERVVLIHRLYGIWRTVRLPAGLASWGYVIGKALGWL